MEGRFHWSLLFLYKTSLLPVSVEYLRWQHPVQEEFRFLLLLHEFRRSLFHNLLQIIGILLQLLQHRVQDVDFPGGGGWEATRSVKGNPYNRRFGGFKTEIRLFRDISKYIPKHAVLFSISLVL